MELSASEQPKKKRKEFIGSIGTTRYIYILPALVLLLGLAIFPLIYSLGISFTDWTIQEPERTFIGLENYGNVLLSDSRWQEAMVRTLAMTAVAVTVELALGLAIAHLLIDPLPGKRIIIVLLILPAVINPIVVGFIWKVLYNPSYGPVNQGIGFLIQRQVDQLWLANQRLAIFSITIAEIWQWTPFMFLVMLAGLVSLNPELYEVAAIDGASKWQVLTKITLPLMKPIIIVAILIRALDIFKLFDLVFVMTSGGPGSSSETISYYIYLLGFKFFRLGYGAAASYLLLIFLSIGVVFLLSRMRREQ
jgi:multiple sugar transport system permease protein